MSVVIRRVASIVALVLAASACATGASGTIGSGAGPSVEVPASSTTTAPTTTPTTVAPTTEPPTTIVDPHEVWVAIAGDEVGVLETFDAPGGEPVAFEFPIVNPTWWETPLALLVVGGAVTDEWVEVALPVRPNGSTAWIRTEQFDLVSHRMRVEVHLAERRVVVYEGDEQVVESISVVGKPETPTPLGRFYVNDVLAQADPAGAYGPWILSLSGYSEALETFGGGLPVIAIHGTNQPDLVGQARSNGCVRVPNEVIEILADLVPVGTPVDILP